VEGIPFERGVHPRCDRKSVEAIERKGVAWAPLSKRVRKALKVKGLNDFNELEEASWAAIRRG
jgi:hypothetical protein